MLSREGGRGVRFFVCALIALLFLANSASAQPKLKLETTDRQTVNATITYEIRTTTFAANKWMIFLPEPPPLPSQEVVRVTADPAGKVVTEKSPLARKVRYAEVRVAAPKAGTGLSMTLEIHATLRARKLVPLGADEVPPEVRALNAVEERYYLSSTTHADHDAKAFREWIDAKQLRRAKDESEIDFAARVLEVLRADFRYRYDPDEDKRASVACRAPAIDCGGMSYIFVGALRASGIPARVLVGRLTRSRKPNSTPTDTDYDHPHIRAELFVAGVGWVPVDPALAHARKVQSVAAFIGRDAGDLLVLHVDADLRLPFPDKEREVQALQIGPAYWTTGTGAFDARIGPTGWELKMMPIKR